MICSRVGERSPRYNGVRIPIRRRSCTVSFAKTRSPRAKINQIFSFTFIFRTYPREALVLEETEAFRLCYYAYPHSRALFLLAGLEPVAEYGSFAKAPRDNTAEQMIFLLRKCNP